MVLLLLCNVSLLVKFVSFCISFLYFVFGINNIQYMSVPRRRLLLFRLYLCLLPKNLLVHQENHHQCPDGQRIAHLRKERKQKA